MRTVDNWASIREHLDFSDPDKFYFIELMQRKKDDETFKANNRMVKFYCVTSLDYYDAIEDEVKKLSDATGARAYILVNRRSYEKCCLNILKDTVQLIQDHNYQHFPKLISTVVGRYADEPNKCWIVDLDGVSPEREQEIKDYIDSIEPYIVGSKIKWENKTLNGKHLITSSFNVQKFSQKFPDIDIHKDNPTLLYFRHE